mmetsp:Transcript_25758/g.38049  ORF Transcript_25758/g.38049 Transcript_25758/m.38049 type:complete len:221 (+) Transcript_25758:140-802(+)
MMQHQSFEAIEEGLGNPLQSGSPLPLRVDCNVDALRKSLSTAESADIQRRNEWKREKLKTSLQSFRQIRPTTRQKKRTSERSPFLVDLVAENERIDEENKVRLTEQIRRERMLEKRRQEAKNDIILRALQEGNELDALRREKRKILEEERRLKALIEIEKTNAHRKEDRLAAERAERRRKTAKSDFQRVYNKDLLEEQETLEKEMLKIKHDISPPPDNTF